ncbi:MACPF domain-containing protein NSL1-like [Gastrolobium bilobum]|uniref:MACPF domain-containing protein NSL1-like n=1 Tax=Gastrolobium bilobum TaxID=150636 RepID=UPI002AB057A3|nr:MACPF domain-containing protein NSL1-like [Gastrolobium bilobum]
MSSIRNAGLEPQSAAEKAVGAIGLGYDVLSDIRFSGCRSRLVELHRNETRDLVVPGGVIVPNVPTSVKCHPGERFRISSELLSFQQMSEQFNQELSLSGKIPSGQFNAMFDMRRNYWKKAAASPKSLAFDGWFITLYNVELDRTHNIAISENVKKEIPTSWNAAALAEFIEKYGTHIVVGVKMGGKDVVHIKQLRSSDLKPTEVQKLLKHVADERFYEDVDRSSNCNTAEISRNLEDAQDMHWKMHIALAASVKPYVECHSNNDDVVSISVRRGGIVGVGQHHNQWMSTVSQSPDVVSMSLMPITSLLNSVSGYGFLSHAVNSYLRHKPPIEELHQFLEFQLPRQWAPGYDLPFRFGPKHKRNMSPALQFTFMGPKLYVNTVKVDSGHRPVTGIRLFLEGRNSDHLGIHLQHLSNLPRTFQILDHNDFEHIDEPVNRGYFEPVKWKMFSHVCTAPIQYDSSHIVESHIVTKAWFEVRHVQMKKVLFLRLGYSRVASSRIRRTEWDVTSSTNRKSGFFSALLSSRLSKELHPPGVEIEKPAKEDNNSAVAYQANSNTDAPVPTKTPKRLRFVDTNEVVRGPDDAPGYWVVTGAKLSLEGGKISIKAKLSLLWID